MTQLCLSNEDIVGELAQNFFPLGRYPFWYNTDKFFYMVDKNWALGNTFRLDTQK
jgi:hypothetical protein